MKDRIKKYMDYKSISAGELSSLLDVQRSNISHILNGRNKPGAAFIEKMLVSFPELNARWLLTGNGEMVESDKIKDSNNLFSQKDIPARGNLNKEIGQIQLNDSPVQNESKTIDKIVVLFTNGTFIDYNRE